MWKNTYFTAWILFIFFEILIEVDYLFSKHPLCRYSDKEYPQWYWIFCYTILGGFLISWMLLLVRIIYAKSGNGSETVFIAFNIVSMGTLATAIALIFNWGGICVDALGFVKN